VVIGLGNPDARYLKNRHNVGFQTIDKISQQLGINLKKAWVRPYEIVKAKYRGQKLYLVKPLTYMNNSGNILKSVLAATNTKIKDLLVICDNLDLEPGLCRLRLKGGSAGQKGLQSIIDRAGIDNIMRIYIGIGKPQFRGQVVDYVLSDPEDSEHVLIEKAINRAAEGALLLLKEKPERVMNVLNRKEKESM
jgi:PTH1 family peptidyl-tRNA hydrolase